MMIIKECRKKRIDPMPYQCEICENYKAIKKEERDLKVAENNRCFKERLGLDGKPRTNNYAPFTNSKREIETTCDNFSHLKILKTR